MPIAPRRRGENFELERTLTITPGSPTACASATARAAKPADREFLALVIAMALPPRFYNSRNVETIRFTFTFSQLRKQNKIGHLDYAV